MNPLRGFILRVINALVDALMNRFTRGLNALNLDGLPKGSFTLTTLRCMTLCYVTLRLNVNTSAVT